MFGTTYLTTARKPVIEMRAANVALSTAVVVLGFGEEPYLCDCLDAVLIDLDQHDELILVDNGIPAALRRTASSLDPRVRVIGDGMNQGFAGGCNAGVAVSTADVVVFVNSDAIVRRDAVRVLARRAATTDGLVCGCLRLADRPELVNSVGNPLQFLGITWAGHCGEPAVDHDTPGPVTIATGGLFAARRETWDRLGGFDPSYLAYHEDTDLSLRCWLSGGRVEFEPQAVADHHYEFARSPQKMFLLERNRWQTVLADYPGPLLAAVLPALVVVEPLLFLVASRQGWAGQKLRAAAWVLRRLPALLRRRQAVQSTRVQPLATTLGLFTDRIEPPMVTPPPGMGLFNRCLAAYWRAVRSRLTDRSSEPDRRGE